MVDGNTMMQQPSPWHEDPTQRTIESAQRELAQLERRLLDQLQGLSKAQEKFEESITRVPTEVDRAVKQLRELMEARLDALATLLQSMIQANATLATTQQAASEAAIAKTERSVEDRLREMSVLFRSETNALDEKIQTNLRRLDQFENRSAGAHEARIAAQDTQKLWIAVMGVVLTMAVLFTGVVTFLNRPVPEPGVRVIERQDGPSTVIDRPNQAVVPDNS